ncbi:Uncharacterised protein [Raoultella terrigena]|uniref:DUF4145 domain-containing protein n=1 Tax=Raoultella terrigena TaxID=577 RepID=A0A4U9D2D8_RAOTE|nr:Uncharacterised protein [Raoultella terrigena]
MSSNYEKLKNEVLALEKEGQDLYFSMLNECKRINDDEKKEFEENGISFVSVSSKYQSWYTKASRVIEQIIPERHNEFVNLYKTDPRRKELSAVNYSIFDYLTGVQASQGTTIIASRQDALPRMETQWLILSSATEKFDSSIFDIKEVLQADLFDTELDTAKELNKKGFIRAAGAVAGVVLEKHLAYVCKQHKFTIKKTRPTISDFYQLLKDNDVIDTPTWRFIQHLGDLRNLCDHGKEREPTKEDVIEFIVGVEKITKTVF